MLYNKLILTTILSFSLLPNIGVAETKTGKASWYGPGFDGKRTASGERFNQNDLTVAHKKLPFNTRLKVTCEATGKSVTVRVNDRGPFVGGRVLDLSKGAAKELGILNKGVAKIKYEILD